MVATFSTVQLSSELAAQTLPLVRATWPAVGLRQWLGYLQFFSGEASPNFSGVNGLCDAAGCYRGLFAYQLERDLLRGPVLAVHLFTAVDIANSLRIVQALLDMAEARALDMGCVAVRISLCESQAELASRLRNLGLSKGGAQFYKKVESNPCSN